MAGNSSNGVMEFGFEEAKVIKIQGVDQFKQSRPGQKDRITIVAFKKYIDGVFLTKAREKGSALTNDEKHDLIVRVDGKLAEQLKKPVAELTEVDRLEIKSPKFYFAFTHFSDGVGSVRCLSTYEGSTCTKPEVCCNKMGDADQTVATVVMSYPVDDTLQVDMEDMAKKKHTHFWIWKLSSKKFKKLEGAYIDARSDGRSIIDLKVTLDGDPKYQKQEISNAGNATWARQEFDPAIRGWILDQGLRAQKYVNNSLGFEMTKEKLIEKLGGQAAAAAAHSGEASADAPKLVTDYTSLLGD